VIPSPWWGGLGRGAYVAVRGKAAFFDRVSPDHRRAAGQKSEVSYVRPHVKDRTMIPIPRAPTSLVALALFAFLSLPIAADERVTDNARTSRSDQGIDSMKYEPPTWPEPPESGAVLFRLAAGTGTVLVLCVLTLVVGRRWLKGPAPKTGTGAQLQLLETLSLGNRCCVHIVRAGRHQVVVGTDGTGLKGLVALPESFERSLHDAELLDTAQRADAPAALALVGTDSA
jgi:flagellar biogenesis protein FliO